MHEALGKSDETITRKNRVIQFSYFWLYKELSDESHEQSSLLRLHAKQCIIRTRCS